MDKRDDLLKTALELNPNFHMQQQGLQNDQPVPIRQRQRDNFYNYGKQNIIRDASQDPKWMNILRNFLGIEVK